MFNFITPFPYLDYIISRYTKKINSFDEVFLKKHGAQMGHKVQTFVFLW
nr:MAG TPA: hypothetical protein [Caudoviricetes sp.]